MELEELKDLIAGNEVAKLVEKVKATAFDFKHDERLDEYNPEGHAVFDPARRKDKKIQVSTGVKDINGDMIMRDDFRKVNRIGFAGQKRIVDVRNMFVTGAGVEIEAAPAKNNTDEENLFKMVLKTIDDNKLHFKWSQIFKASESEGECALLFYFEKTDFSYWGDLGNTSTIVRPRMQMLKYSDGDRFYPIFNVYKDMIAFARLYTVNGKEWLDLYTDREVFKYRQTEGGWELLEGDFIDLADKTKGRTRTHGFDRIPLSYFPSYEKMWADQQSANDRLEFLFSVHGDINDYNGSPILVGIGEVESAPAAGEPGKFFVLKGEGADLKYVKWDSAPESIKNEIEHLLKNLYTTSRTPNVSFEEVKGIGAISAVALRLLFLDAHAAAKEHQDGAFGESCQRAINIIKHSMATVDVRLKEAVQSLSIKVKFSAYIPKNEAEELANQQTQVSTLATALQADLISHQSAIKAMPPELVADPEAEFVVAQEQRTEKQVTMQF